MGREKKLWIAFILITTISFAVLGYYGYEIYQKAPPLPERVVTSDGKVVFEGQDIKDGQNVWQSMGGQEVGSVWGHGAYLAPDWTADWLHRESIFILNKWAEREHKQSYESLNSENQAALERRLQLELRKNTYDPVNGTLTISAIRTEAIEYLNSYYTGLFMENSELDELRTHYAIPKNSIKDKGRMRQMSAFFFWATWACVTERPGSDITYTNNWPAEDLVGNKPTGDLLIWTGVSITLLLIGIAGMVFTMPD